MLTEYQYHSSPSLPYNTSPKDKSNHLTLLAATLPRSSPPRPQAAGSGVCALPAGGVPRQEAAVGLHPEGLAAAGATSWGPAAARPPGLGGVGPGYSLLQPRSQARSRPRPRNHIQAGAIGGRRCCCCKAVGQLQQLSSSQVRGPDCRHSCGLPSDLLPEPQPAVLPLVPPALGTNCRAAGCRVMQHHGALGGCCCLVR